MQFQLPTTTAILKLQMLRKKKRVETCRQRMLLIEKPQQTEGY